MLQIGSLNLSDLCLFWLLWLVEKIWAANQSVQNQHSVILEWNRIGPRHAVVCAHLWNCCWSNAFLKTNSFQRNVPVSALRDRRMFRRHWLRLTSITKIIHIFEFRCSLLSSIYADSLFIDRHPHWWKCYYSIRFESIASQFVNHSCSKLCACDVVLAVIYKP